MSTDKRVKDLVLNTLTKAQYDEITPKSDELYFITDALSDGATVLGNYVYVDNANGADIADEGRGLARDKAFKTVQGALNIMSYNNYRVGNSDCTMRISNYPDNAVERLTVPSIESNGGNLVISGVEVKGQTNQQSLIIHNPTKIRFTNVVFSAENSNISVIQLWDSNADFSNCKVINNSARLSASMIDMVDSYVGMYNVAFQHNGEMPISSWVNADHSKIIYMTKADVESKAVKVRCGFVLDFSTFEYEGISIPYPSDATDWIPFDIKMSNMYLRRITYDNFYYNEEHKGTSDKMSMKFDINGLVEN